MKKEAQEVDLAVQISGDYAAWHELSISLLWDFTNDKKLSFKSKEEVENLLEEGHDGEYSDTEMKKGVLVDGKYYIKV